jgi:hypothetical protein
MVLVGGALVTVGPGDHTAARGRGHFRVSDAERDQVIDALKDAFVQGRLTMDELCGRAGQALGSRTYAELAAITADIPAVVIKAPPPAEHARAPTRKPVNKRAVAWAASLVILPPALGAAFLTYYGGFIVLFLFVFVGVTVTTGPSSS